jgi:hypothetical protein
MNASPGPGGGIVDLDRPLTAQQDLAASLSHVEHPVIDNGFTFRFAGRRDRIFPNEKRQT